MLADPTPPAASIDSSDAAHASAVHGDPLDEAVIQEGLPGWRVAVLPSTGSTNTDLLQEVRRASEPGVPRLLASERQTAGRGRLGRRWSSAAGASLTMSVALGIPRRLAALDGVTLVCGLAVLDVVRAHGVAGGLKWPNDLVVGHGKLGGILVETHATGSSTTVVVGVGLNVRAVGDEDPGGLPATNLAAAGGVLLKRNRLAVEIALALGRRVASFGASGFEALVDEWNAVDAWRDRAVRLQSAGTDVRRGVARGVDATGALRFEVDGTIERIISGDLSLRTDDPA